MTAGEILRPAHLHADLVILSVHALLVVHLANDVKIPRQLAQGLRTDRDELGHFDFLLVVFVFLLTYITTDLEAVKRVGLRIFLLFVIIYLFVLEAFSGKRLQLPTK